MKLLTLRSEGAAAQLDVGPLIMTIRLTKKQIDATLPKVEKGLGQYLWLQSKVAASGQFEEDSEFRKKYNHFYRIRRPDAWQNTFYGLMARAKREHLQFHAVIEALKQSTGRHEASFASKLVATLNPSMPVIDSVVLKNLNMRLPAASAPDRIKKICKLHENLTACFSDYLKSENGEYLVSQFKEMYPRARVTKTKILDLVLWQTRA